MDVLSYQLIQEVSLSQIKKHLSLKFEDNSTLDLFSLIHQVLPSYFAMKRASKILFKKVQQCISELSSARTEISSEIWQLDQNVNKALEKINRTYAEVIDVVDKRRKELLALAEKIGEDKRRILDDQLHMIKDEEIRVKTEFEELEPSEDLNAIANRMRELSIRRESLRNLLNPRENFFLTYENSGDSPIKVVEQAVKHYGAVRSSTTCPYLSEVNIGKCFAKMGASATIVTYDFSGKRQCRGGDTLTVTLVSLDQDESVPVHVTDKEDGTHEARFILAEPGTYRMKITVFNHAIKNQPLIFKAHVYTNSIYQNWTHTSDDSHPPIVPYPKSNKKSGFICDSDTVIISSAWAQNSNLKSPGSARAIYCGPLKFDDTTMRISHAAYLVLTDLVCISTISDSHSLISIVNIRDNFRILDSFKIENIIQCIATVPLEWSPRPTWKLGGTEKVDDESIKVFTTNSSSSGEKNGSDVPQLSSPFNANSKINYSEFFQS